MFICHYVKHTLHLWRTFKYIIMKTNYLFPVVFRKIGWCLFIPFLLLGICYLVSDENFLVIGGSNALALFDGYSDTKYFCITQNDSWTDELIIVSLTVSMLFIGFSREKDEDECIATIRMNALVWAILINSALLILGTLFIYGLPFLNFMSIYMFSLLLLFIFRYLWKTYQFRNND